MKIACPVDEKDDTIKKVSAIYKSDTSYDHETYTDYEGYDVQRPVTRTTMLARMLTPPSKPSKPNTRFDNCCIFGGLLVIFYPLAGLLMVGTSIFFSTVSEGQRLFSVLIILFLILLLYLIFARSYVNRLRKRGERAYLVNTRVYELSKDRWNELYYCSRHDIVFDPKTGESCPPQNIQQLIQHLLKSGM